MGTYTKSSINRTARPRSERLRELGGLIVPTSAAAAASYSGYGASHVHPNLTDLNKITVTEGYIYLSTDVANPDTGDVTRELVKVNAGYADRALANADGYTLDWFIPVTVDGTLVLKLNPTYAGLIAEGFLSDGGIASGGGGGGGGGSSTLYGLTDVSIPQPPSTPALNDVLAYSTSLGKWTNVSKSTFLSGYATTSDLSGKQDAYAFTIQGASGATYNLANFITGISVDNKSADIGTSLTTIATVAGVDIKAKITHQSLSGYVPNTRNVNGHALSSDVTVTAADLNLGNVENTALSTWAGSANINTIGTLTSGSVPLTLVTGADDLKAIEALAGTSGFLKKTSANAWALDTNTYLTGNQTITLSGDVSGSGTTAITVSIGTGKVTNAMLAGSIENSKLNTIGVTKGGTGLTSISKGAILYASGSNTIAALSANGTSTKKFLTQTNDNAPAWGTIAFGDLPTMYAAGATVGSSRERASLITVEAISYNLSSGSSDKSRIYWDAGNEGWHLQGNLIIDGWVADGGIGTGGGGGGSSTLAGLNDVTLTSPVQNDVLVYGSQNSWINVSKSSFLSGYATQSWVGQQGYLTSSALSGYATETWVGQQGFITGGYIGKTALQASSASQDLTGIKQVVFESTNSPSNNSLSFAQDGLYNRPRWTYRDTSTMPASSVSKFLAYKDDIPSIYALTLSAGSFQAGTYNPKTAAGSFNIPTTLDHISDGSTRKLSDYLPLSGGTMTGNITLDGVSILPSGDAVDGGSGLGYLGSSSKRFRQGHIRDIYTSYFVFKDGSSGATRGSINYTAGAGFLSVVDGNDSSKTFSYKFYVNSSSNGFFYEEGSGANVPLGKSDHRWSKIWGIDGNLSGNLALAQTSHIDIGPLRIEYDDANKALHITKVSSSDANQYGLYTDGILGDGGIRQTS